jgi:hypothetical protein
MGSFYRDEPRLPPQAVQALGGLSGVNGSDATFLLDHPGDIHGLIGADNFVDTIASTSPFLEGHLPALLIGADTLFLDVITAPGLPAF